MNTYGFLRRCAVLMVLVREAFEGLPGLSQSTPAAPRWRRPHSWTLFVRATTRPESCLSHALQHDACSASPLTRPRSSTRTPSLSPRHGSLLPAHPFTSTHMHTSFTNPRGILLQRGPHRSPGAVDHRPCPPHRPRPPRGRERASLHRPPRRVVCDV